MNYSLIVPIYNERKTLKQLIKKLKNLPHNIEIIIVDDGSNDGTRGLLKNQIRFNIIHNKQNSGKGFSIRKAIKFASKDIIILIDGDLEIDIENIPNILKKYESINKDVLIGKRWQNNGLNTLKNISDFGNYIINKFFNLIYNTNFSDILCCLKIIKKTHLENLNLTSNGFSIESEIMSKLAIEKRSISEVNITYNRRSIEQGKKLKMFHGVDIILTIIKNKIF